jgi:hypothetical protein
MLYGPYVMSGRIDPRTTVKQLGLQEAEPFLPIEEHATLEHLLGAHHRHRRERRRRRAATLADDAILAMAIMSRCQSSSRC